MVSKENSDDMAVGKHIKKWSRLAMVDKLDSHEQQVSELPDTINL